MFRYIAPLLVLLLFSCVESVEIEEQETPSLLVVEAALTDEFKTQHVRLTRSFGFETDTIPPETRARVSVETGQGETYSFSPSADGTYSSDRQFAITPGLTYELVISTPDGTVYRSDPEVLVGTSAIEDLYAVRETNQNGTDGVFIYLDSSPGEGNPTYYRYEYDETYKIVAPNYSSFDFRLTDYDPCTPTPEIEYTLEIVPRTEEVEVCYKTVPSTNVIQNDATTLSEPNIRRFPVRFLGSTDFMIRHRYSILVRQYVQSPAAFSYFQVLEQFSSSESIFNSVQPGFLNGNIRAVGRGEAPVIGYFEVASVSERRLFFNFEEVFPDLEQPPYITNCGLHSSPEAHLSYCIDCVAFPDACGGANPCPMSIVESVDLGLITYVDDNAVGIGTCPGPYIYVERVCGDCTVLGSNIVPEFWIE
ncbi:DUF4249 domain-containing protein [Robiginitalea sp.]|uniref:DUF4249 domain-containing protein n=1 Tax=Robiginitalea sp. TaxID=1902411 RepID=UPI003C73099C